MSILPLFLLVWTLLIGRTPDYSQQIGNGIHPAVATDPLGAVHVVYGQGNVMYYTTSHNGNQFKSAVRVDSLPGLHLGASRGPQIAATAQSAVITAIDKPGNVWAYTLNRTTGQWQPKVRVTDVDDIAKEGFVALTANQNNTYNAVWLDLRTNRRNKIVGARSTDGGRTWSANQVLYASPDGTVCECCQLSAVSQGNRVAVMFRNFLNGSRDMYLLQSTDGGQSFGKAQKIGEGTWKLNACPMDGGGLFMAADGTLATVWRRADTLFTARPGQPEATIGTGKQAKTLVTPNGQYVIYQQNGQVWLTKPNQAQPTAVGPGAYPKLALLPNNRVLCLWEHDGTVRAMVIQ
jgi:hypothetical protein